MIDQQKPVAGVSEDVVHGGSVAASSHNMASVDLHSYLLAASPPGFDIHYAIKTSLRSFHTEDSPCLSQHRVITAPTPSPRQPSSTKNNRCFREATTHSRSQCASHITDFFSDVRKAQVDSTSNSDSDSKPVKRRVCFADELGKQLEHIRILTDRSGSPPLFGSEILSSLNTASSSSKCPPKPALRLNFAQPASDYVCFREKLEASNVSLENVIIKDDRLVGTIKVKNLAFQKSVTVRYTCDDWETFTDCPASYVSTSNCSLQFDTFSFDISPESQQTIQFAVLFEVHGLQYWDNNGGKNYAVLPTTVKDTVDGSNTEDSVFGLDVSSSWTQYCAWSGASNSVPYW